jgi:apolipoprotein N-acyltransferase
VLRAQIIPRSGDTPFLRYGNLPILLLAAAALLAALVARRRELSPASPV